MASGNLKEFNRNANNSHIKIASNIYLSVLVATESEVNMTLRGVQWYVSHASCILYSSLASSSYQLEFVRVTRIRNDILQNRNACRSGLKQELHAVRRCSLWPVRYNNDNDIATRQIAHRTALEADNISIYSLKQWLDVPFFHSLASKQESPAIRDWSSFIFFWSAWIG